MTKCNQKTPVRTIGIDLAKDSFHLWGVDEKGRVRLDRKMTRKQMTRELAQLPPCLIGMEACGSANHWARVLSRQGHKARLISPQHVKPFVKSNKNDRNDAEAICEAVQRPNMRFVTPKSMEQQDLQAMHRARSQVVGQRTALVNQMRGLLLDRGIAIPKGRAQAKAALPGILEDGENGLSAGFRETLHTLCQRLADLDGQVQQWTGRLERMAENDPQAQLLMTIPGFGPIIATALLATAGDVAAFRSGRELAAWAGLVPRQHSTGGKQRLLGISKRGDAYLRQLLIHGARSVVMHSANKADPLHAQAQRQRARRPYNVAVVAVANRLLRIAHAVLRDGEPYRGRELATA